MVTQTARSWRLHFGGALGFARAEGVKRMAIRVFRLSASALERPTVDRWWWSTDGPGDCPSRCPVTDCSSHVSVYSVTRIHPGRYSEPGVLSPLSSQPRAPTSADVKRVGTPFRKSLSRPYSGTLPRRRSESKPSRRSESPPPRLRRQQQPIPFF